LVSGPHSRDALKLTLPGNSNPSDLLKKLIVNTMAILKVGAMY